MMMRSSLPRLLKSEQAACPEKGGDEATLASITEIREIHRLAIHTSIQGFEERSINPISKITSERTKELGMMRARKESQSEISGLSGKHDQELTNSVPGTLAIQYRTV